MPIKVGNVLERHTKQLFFSLSFLFFLSGITESFVVIVTEGGWMRDGIL